MPEMNDDRSLIRQNLLDAGCDRKTTESCMACFTAGAPAKMLPQLVKHRRVLLDALHREQKRIDCLDYLVYTIEKNEKQKEAKK